MSLGKSGKFFNATTIQANDHIVNLSLVLTLQHYSKKICIFNFWALAILANFETLQRYRQMTIFNLSLVLTLQRKKFAYLIFEMWRVWEICQLYNATGKWPYRQLFSLANSTTLQQKKSAYLIFDLWRVWKICQLYNSTGK